MASKALRPPLWTIILLVLLVGALALVVLGSFSLQKEADNLDQANKGLQEIVFEIEAEASALKEELGEKSDALDAMQAQLLEAQKRGSATETETEADDALQQQLAGANTALEQRTRELREAEAEIGRQAALIAALRGSAEQPATTGQPTPAGLQRALAEAKAALAETRAAHEKERERSRELAARLAAQRAESPRRSEADARALADLTADRDALLVWAKSLETSSAGRSGQLAEHDRERDALEKRLQEAIRDRDALLAWVDRVEGRRAERSASATPAEAQEETLRRLEAALEEARAQATTERAAMERRLEEAKRDREALLAWVEHLRAAPADGSRRAADTRPGTVAELTAELSAGLRRAGLTTVGVEPADEQSVVIKLHDRMLFGAGSASISPGGVALLERIAVLLGDYPQLRVTVEGHTDNIPVGDQLGRRFSSNWELSSARAAEAARHLAQSGRLAPERLAAVGLSDTRPVGSNATAEGRRLNRRIEIRLALP